MHARTNARTNNQSIDRPCADLGTEVTTPVPLPIEMVMSGSVYTLSNCEFGAARGRPSRSHLRGSGEVVIRHLCSERKRVGGGERERIIDEERKAHPEIFSMSALGWPHAAHWSWCARPFAALCVYGRGTDE